MTRVLVSLALIVVLAGVMAYAVTAPRPKVEAYFAVGVDGKCGKGNQPTCPPPTPTPTPTPTAVPTPTPTAPPTPTPTPSGCTRSLTAGQAIVPVANETLCLHAGEYPGFTSAASGWTLTSYPGEWAYIDGNLSPTRSRLVELAGSGITLSRLTVQDAQVQWGAGVWVTGDDVTVGPQVEARRNHSFGIKVTGGALRATITEANLWSNDTGFEASSGDITGLRLINSDIHDHQTMIVDGTGGARGANATNFYHTTGAALIAGNRIWNNRAVSVTYGFDGGAFEIYGSTDLTYDANRIWDSQNVMEMGTDGPANERITLTNNVAYDATTAPVQGPMGGLILRGCRVCDFAGNRFYGMDGYTVTVVTSNFTAGVINFDLDIATNQIETESRAHSTADWTGVSAHDNTYFLLPGGSVGYSPLGPGETVVTGPNPVRA